MPANLVRVPTMRRRHLLLQWPLWLLPALSACPDGKPAASESSAPADTECPVVCPELLGLPCNVGLEAEAAYDYCDVCGVSWRCALTGSEAGDYLMWASSDVPCACITAKGEVDTAVPGCEAR